MCGKVAEGVLAGEAGGEGGEMAGPEKVRVVIVGAALLATAPAVIPVAFMRKTVEVNCACDAAAGKRHSCALITWIGVTPSACT